MFTEKEKEILRYIVQDKGGTVEAMKQVASFEDAQAMIEINAWKIRKRERKNVLLAELEILNELLDEQSGN